MGTGKEAIEQSMTDGSIMRSIIGFAVPMLIASIFQQLYSLVDTLIVSKYLGADALAGVGSTGQITFLTLCLALGMGNGSGLIIAQCFGGKDLERLKRTVISMSYVMAILAVIMSVIGFAFSRVFLLALNVPGNVIGYSVTYIRIIFAFSAGTVFYNWGSSILRSIGDPKTPLYALICSSFVNIALDFLFILRFHLGVAGAAGATVIAQLVSGVICAVAIVRRRKLLGFGAGERSFIPDRSTVILIIKTSIPSIFQSCMISIGGISVQRLINSFGSEVMAGYVAAARVDGLAIQVILAVGNALCVFTGQNIGASRYDRIAKALSGSRLVMIMSAAAIAICVFLLRYQIIGMFIDPVLDPEALHAGAEYLSIVGVAYLICAVMQSYQNVIRGAGDVNTCLVAGMTELAGKIAFAYITAPFLGPTGIWISTPFSWACGCVIPVVRYYSGKWRYKKLTS